MLGVVARPDEQSSAVRGRRPLPHGRGDPSLRTSRGNLVVAGAVVCLLAAAAYLAALLSHPASALLDGFDLRVYLAGGSLVRNSPGALYTWHFRHSPGTQFLYAPFAALVFAALSYVPWRVLNDVAAIADI